MENNKTKYLIIFIIALIICGSIFFIKKSDSIHTEADLSKKKAQVIQLALSEYFKKCGAYPNSAEGFQKLKVDNGSCGYIASENIKVSDDRDVDGENFIYSSDGKSYQFKTSSSIEWTKENSIFERK